MRNPRNLPRLGRFPFPLDLAPRMPVFLLRPVLQLPFAFERFSSSEVASAQVPKIELVPRWKSAHGQLALVVLK